MASVARPGGHHTMEEEKNSGDGEKIRIAKIGGRFLVFDVADVARLRRQHNICAVLVGITPQAPNQTVFSSLPLELTADEVRWLVYERHAAYVADDWQAHLAKLAQPAARRAYLDSVLRQRQAAQVLADEVTAERERRGAEVRAAQAAKRAAKNNKKVKTKKVASKGGDQPEVSEEKTVPVVAEKETKTTVVKEPAGTVAADDIPHKIVVSVATDRANDHADSEPLLRPPPRTEEVMQQEDDFIFGGLVEVERMKAERARRGTSPTPEKMTKEVKKEEKKEAPKNLVSITPTTSAGLFEGETGGDNALLIPPRSTSPASASSFSPAALRAHLADRGYYTTPGLRFGGALSVYPGDPFRYHAHFVANSYGWDEPIKMLDVVGTGRLATGVKKGLLIGGARPVSNEKGDGAEVRTFTLEWAAI